jgi:hypothetical protein
VQLWLCAHIIRATYTKRRRPSSVRHQSQASTDHMAWVTWPIIIIITCLIAIISVSYARSYGLQSHRKSSNDSSKRAAARVRFARKENGREDGVRSVGRIIIMVTLV